MDDDLRVAAGVKGMSQCLQLGNKGLIVVDLAVEDHDDGSILVVERLLARLEIDDREPPVAECHSGSEMLAAPVRSPVALGVVHPPEEHAVGLAVSAQIAESRDTAHQATSRRASRRWPYRAPYSASMRRREKSRTARSRPPGRAPRAIPIAGT